MSKFQNLIDEYTTLEAFIDDKEAELKQVKEVRNRIKQALMAEMATIGIDHGKSTAGHTVTIVRSSSVKVVDAEAFFDFVFETGDSDFLTKRASSEAVEQYVAINNQLPPGVEMESSMTLRFNKAK